MERNPFRPFKSWFGYTRRERRSTFILLCLIVIVLFARVIVPERNINVQLSDMGYIEFARDSLPVSAVSSSRPSITTGRKSIQSAPLEINTCDSASLEALPGIGPVLASRILKFRKLLNGYASVDQLKEVYGLSEETFNIISSRLTCDPARIRKININDADYRQLIRLPYFEKAEVNAILKYRELQGSIRNIQVLVDNKIIPYEKTPRLQPYLNFGE